MEITEAQYARIDLPVQRGEDVVGRFGRPEGAQRHLVRCVFRRMANIGFELASLRQLAHHLHALAAGRRTSVLDRVFDATRTDRAHQARSAVAGQHHRQGAVPMGRPGAKKNGPQSIGRSRGGWTTKLHMVAADARTAVTFSLSPGQRHDAPEGREAAAPSRSPARRPVALVMDRAWRRGRDTPTWH